MTESTTIRVNPLPSPTWRWLRINDAEITLPSVEWLGEALAEVSVPDGAGAKPAFTAEEMDRLSGLETGMGQAFQEYTSGAPVDPFLWKTAAGEKTAEPLVARIYATGTESTVNRFLLAAEKDSELTILQYLTKEDSAAEKAAGSDDNGPVEAGSTSGREHGDGATEPGSTSGREHDAAAAEPVSMTVDTRLYLHAGAKVKLIQVCNTFEEMSAYSDVGAYLEEGADLEILQIAISAKDTFFGIAADLAGKGSHLGIRTGYQAAQGQKIDVNYVARHRGEQTTTSMDTKGVLWKGAAKSWRATVDFIRGCRGARGSEREDVLLLDEDVVNKTIPLILCQEEDVEGEHGATIGDLSDDVLLYFRSRGIDDETAYRLMATGRLLGCVSQVPDAALRAELMTALGEEPEESE